MKSIKTIEAECMREIRPLCKTEKEWIEAQKIIRKMVPLCINMKRFIIEEEKKKKLSKKIIKKH